MSIPKNDTAKKDCSASQDAEFMALLDQTIADKELARSTEQNSNAGQGFMAILAVFFSFLKNNQSQPEQNKDILTDKSVSNLFKSFGFSNDDMEYLRQTGEKVRSGETNIFTATKNIYERIENPQKTLSSNEAKAAVEAREPQTNSAINMPLEERRDLVIQAIPKAAKAAGVSPETMKAVWGVESGFGKNLTSPKNCKGDWQFTNPTWNSIMKRYGDEIAKHIKENHPEYTQTADKLAANNEQYNALNDLKFDPIVSTYAAAYLKMDDAKVIGVDPSKQENRAQLYSAYNIGSPDAKKLHKMATSNDQHSAQAVIGDSARTNPLYFKGDVTAKIALARMEEELGRYHDKYYKLFGKLEKDIAQETTLANNNSSLTETYNHTQATDGRPGTAINPPRQPNPLPFDGKGVDQTTLNTTIINADNKTASTAIPVTPT